MFKKAAIVILTVGTLIILPLALSFGGAVLSGYAKDKHCTAEEDNDGECARTDDARNSAWAWLHGFGRAVAILAALAALCVVIVCAAFTDVFIKYLLE